MVQLEPTAGAFISCEIACFNSIMVQLEHTEIIEKYLKKQFQFHYGSIRTSQKMPFPCYIASEFQFHYGSIRTKWLEMCEEQDKNFQFHYGSIRTPQVCLSTLSFITFNSIMVQLEHATCRLNRYGLFFQFHYGSIRTDTDFVLPSVPLLSIPLWFN